MSTEDKAMTAHVEQPSPEEQKIEEQKHLANHAVDLYDSEGIRLIPSPSNDPNDPLRVPPWRKNMVILALCFYTAGCLAATTSLSPIIPTLIQYYGAFGGASHPSAQNVMNLGTYPTLFGGIGAIITILAARWIGTRPVLILSSVLLFFATLWSAVSQGKDRGLYSNIAARCFVGLGTGAYESVVPLILQDINFIHQRNRALGFVLGSGGMAGAVFGALSTYIVAGLGWRSLFWIINIITGIGVIMIILFVPETTWPRRISDLTGTSERNADGFVPSVRPPQPPTPYLHSLRLFSGRGSGLSAWCTAKDLVRSATFPNVIWIVLLNACMSGTTVASTLVISTILQGPYHWAARNVGLSMLSIAMGALLTIPVTGVVGDAVIKFVAKKKRVHLPEHQLINLILPVVVGLIGTIGYGVVAARPDKYHWMVLLAMMTFQFFASSSINILSTTYAIECYPDLAGVMVIVCGAYRNIVGFGLTYGAQGFINAAGALGCFGTYAGILGVLGLSGILFYFMGPAVRLHVNSWKFRRSAFVDDDMGI
ncbi:hypothetical protein ASPVEDRAFT_78240 [Aspergillus versicolor CBS 583.65]|uniref:Major facilitator superfamily (MFS) profile domain-containing protein n=1 Tax=Aspergillus versicolor CBS 583.65 TaxID=1036611 RepID=A0A1L9P4M2_ASPVE|nr:uncharacterized protein ASPVEDRAFT_78240 [Aspergillus versicolor CBS 583.65]OJI96471.1 hypothetical protein ASPVEDRAFT_78240 [Aspergillus versicolor CBS 583.65]